MIGASQGATTGTDSRCGTANDWSGLRKPVPGSGAGARDARYAPLSRFLQPACLCLAIRCPRHLIPCDRHGSKHWQVSATT
jgi:hypothetical protein